MSTLGQVIEALEKVPADMVFPRGFGQAFSYRGYYDQLAFEPRENSVAAQMLAEARSALGKTFSGYKGGDYKMEDWTDCWLAEYGESDADGLDIEVLIAIAKLQAELAAARKVVAAAEKLHREDCNCLCECGECSPAVPCPVGQSLAEYNEVVK